MLNLGSCLSFAVLNLALGFVKHTEFIQLGIGAAARRDLPDHLTTFMFFTLLDTGVSSVRVHRIFFAMQQLGHRVSSQIPSEVVFGLWIIGESVYWAHGDSSSSNQAGALTEPGYLLRKTQRDVAS